MLTSRQFSVLRTLIETRELSIKELSKKYNLSSRMIRYEIDTINYQLSKSGLPLITKQRGGVVFYEDIQILEQYLQEIEIIDLPPQDRAILLILTLLNNQKIDIDQYFKNQNASRSVKMTTMSTMDRLLNSANIELVNDNNMISLYGDEISIRRYLLSLFHQSKNKTNLIGDFLFKTHFYFEDQELIKNFIYLIFQDNDSLVSEDAFQTIQNYINIMLTRIYKNHSITALHNTFFLSQTKWFDSIQKNKIQLEKYYNISISESEIFYLIDYFIGGSFLKTTFSYYDNWVELYNIVRKVVLSVEQELGIRLSSDKELLEGLMIHIKSMIHRLKNEITFSSEAYEEIVECYPDLYDLIEDKLSPLNDMFDIKFDKNEIAFITIHFQTSISRLESFSTVKKRVVLVCGMGLGTSTYLSYQLQCYYDIDIVEILPFYLLEKFLLNEPHIDYIITTLSIDEYKIEVPIIKINTFLKKEDFEQLDNSEISRKKTTVFSLRNLMKIIQNNCTIYNKNILIKELEVFFSHNLNNDINLELKKDNVGYFALDHVQIASPRDWKDAISLGAGILLNKGYITAEYINEIIANIENLGTYMIEGNIAYPHSKPNSNVLRTGFSLLLLEKPILFPNNKKVTIILTIATNDGVSHKDMMITLMDRMQQESFSNIVQQRDISNIYQFLAEE